jgi:hypothetical protein
MAFIPGFRKRTRGYSEQEFHLELLKGTKNAPYLYLTNTQSFTEKAHKKSESPTLYKPSLQTSNRQCTHQEMLECADCGTRTSLESIGINTTPTQVSFHPFQ